MEDNRLEHSARTPFEWVAHRGYPSRYPENTRLGFEKAIEAGARFIEADVQISADGIPVIFHDQTLERLCGCKGVVHRTPKADLDRLSAFEPGRFGNRFKGVRLMDLADMVDLLRRNPEVVLYLEIKRIVLKAFRIHEVLNAILPLLEPVKGQVVLISFSVFALKAAKVAGWQRLGPVLSRWSDIYKPAVTGLAPEIIFIHHRRLPMGIHYHSEVTELAFYEVSDPALAQSLAKRGASFIETDAIGEMLAADYFDKEEPDA
ncbi:MAG: glycerophosphodiester phosphodiesterase family protein [Motiliproteus sp.]|nr:glycerophosphodiester phosphodiesterase family protein [Motiliproteus sp.]MCW9051791.1 glycerophosphodiester phosphodiesterase family protein [Motiliproteus sp.]